LAELPPPLFAFAARAGIFLVVAVLDFAALFFAAGFAVRLAVFADLLRRL
jgi:hypothetical protein